MWSTPAWSVEVVNSFIFTTKPDAINQPPPLTQQMSSNTSKTILLLAANPKGTTPLRLDEEVREIGEGLQRALHREQFELVQRWAVRPQDVRRAMLDEKPQIVHLSGHGAREEGLVFEDEVGQPYILHQLDRLLEKGVFISSWLRLPR